MIANFWAGPERRTQRPRPLDVIIETVKISIDSAVIWRLPRRSAATDEPKGGSNWQDSTNDDQARTRQSPRDYRSEELH